MNRAFIFDMDGVIFDSERLYIECSLEASAELGLPQEGVIELCHRCIGVTPEYNAGRMDVKPGAEELLKFLKQQGYPLAIASSTPTEIVRQELSAAGLLDYFDRIVGGDQVSRSKPNPDIFLRAAELLRTEPSRCIVIEDSFNGIRAAKAAGMTAVMVPDQLQPDEEIKALADRIELSLLHVLQELRSAAELPAET